MSVVETPVTEKASHAGDGETARTRAAAFYVTGGTVPGDAASYVTRRADTELLDTLLAGEFCYVLNTRQMGKSSLCVRAIARLRERGVRTVFLDLTRIGGQNATPDQWYAGLLSEIGRSLGLRAEFLRYWKENGDVPQPLRLFGAVREIAVPAVAEPIVVFVDEVDAVRSLPFPTDEFFSAIRECHTARAEDPALERLTFCLLGVATPADLIADTRTSPFNIGKRVRLEDFTTDEAAPLAEGLGENGAALIACVLHWTGGHPYLTQRLCRALAEEGASAPTDVDRLTEDLFLARAAHDADDNLSFVRNRLLRSEVDVAALLHLYAQVWAGKTVRDDETDPLVPVLRLSGVCRADAGRLRVRNRIYERVFDREWVENHLPDAELRRQKAAYRRGVLRTVAVAGAAVVVVGSLAVAALYNATVAVKRAADSRRLLYAADMSIAQQAVEEVMPVRARLLLAGHVPQSGEEDLRTFEWRYLFQQLRDESQRAIRLPVPSTGSLALSPDGKTLATSAEDGGIILWDVATGTPRETRTGDGIRQYSLAFSPDGKTLAACSAKWEVALWDLTAPPGTAPRRLPRLAPPKAGGGPSRVYFWPDGKTLGVEFGSLATRRWDVANNRLAVPDRVWAFGVTFSPDGTRFSGLQHKNWQLLLFDARTCEPTGRVGTLVNYSAFSPDGRTLALLTDGTVRLWDVARNAPVGEIPLPENGQDTLAFSPDGRTLATGGDDAKISLWDLPPGAGTARPRAVLRGHDATVAQLAFLDDGKTLVSASGDGTVRFWNPTARPLPDILRGRAENILLSPDGKTLSSRGGNSGDTLTVRDARTLEPVGPARLGRQAGFPLCYSPDGRWLYVVQPTKPSGYLRYNRPVPVRLEREEVATGRRSPVALPPSVPALPDYPLPLYGYPYLVASPDGRTLLLMTEQGGDAFLFGDGPERRLPAVPDFFAAAFSPDGRRVVLAGRNTLRTFDVPTGRAVGDGTPGTDFRAIAFSPDGRYFAAGSGGGDVSLWDGVGPVGKPVAGLEAHRGDVFAVAFSPDSQTLATGGFDGAVRVWNVRTWRQTLHLRAHPFNARFVAFSPDGNRLYSYATEQLRVFPAGGE